jgi:ribosomal protein S8
MVNSNQLLSEAVVLNSKLCKESLNILYEMGYIRNYTILDLKRISVLIKYINSKHIIRQLFVVSKPRRRLYIKYRQLTGFLINNGIFTNSFLVCSTNKGLLTDIEAIAFKSGGEPLFFFS